MIDDLYVEFERSLGLIPLILNSPALNIKM